MSAALVQQQRTRRLPFGLLPLKWLRSGCLQRSLIHPNLSAPYRLTNRRKDERGLLAMAKTAGASPADDLCSMWRAGRVDFEHDGTSLLPRSRKEHASPAAAQRRETVMRGPFFVR